ncbi:MAG: DUF5615 family PIN-like protein [Candidatus Auribacterota bacterium]|nr:DUF5615 family PIN-like protein [Candidatus Auribacterota bacterium]
MKFKLDENFGTRTLHLFRESGHDVISVIEQELQGCDDNRLYGICRDEERCLVTLDLDFADITRFNPDEGSGIVVIRLPHSSSLIILEKLVSQFLEAISEMKVKNQLWIIEINRIRIHQK